MKLALPLTLALMGILLASCTTPGKSYAGKHPELSAAHRQILASGKMPAGDAVAGLTHDEVRIAMNGAPATFDKINGEEAWIYLRKNTVVSDIEPPHPSPGSTLDHESFSPMPGTDLETDGMVKTTIFFQGGRATRAEVSLEKR
ncbi:MAG TPA: hypothetical protein VGO11_18975 [Chthoniobacteraceae bacterium]|nr:hypothetical protein [Chthoniobacteraceae bacterium]